MTKKECNQAINKPFDPGSLLIKSKNKVLNKSVVRLYKIPYCALELKEDETYQHHLVSQDFFDLDGTEYLFLLHFFISPEYVQYYPSEKIIANKNNKYVCVAYFLFNGSIWTSNTYSSVNDFNLDFEIIPEEKEEFNNE